jgi:hypothetical protein
LVRLLGTLSAIAGARGMEVEMPTSQLGTQCAAEYWLNALSERFRTMEQVPAPAGDANATGGERPSSSK